MTTPSDIEIAQATAPQPILAIAESVRLGEDDLELYGKYKAKVHLDVLSRFQSRQAEASLSRGAPKCSAITKPKPRVPRRL